MELSMRLSAVASLVTEGCIVADIGTDHGYIPIWLLEADRIPKAFAMDVRKGPLKRAEEHITGHGLGKYIETRLSDGLAGLKPNEADCMIAAGMGGNLIIRILEDGMDILQTMKECILQPQSEVSRVREYLFQAGLRIIEENMILEDGKYYPVMKAVWGSEKPYTSVESRFGRQLLQQKNPVLKQFVIKEIAVRQQILEKLSMQGGDKAKSRIKELRTDFAELEEALCLLEN